MPKPHETYTFFLDRCLGTSDVSDILQKAGAIVELHDNHFPQDCNDETWLTQVSARKWVILTKDKRIRYRPLERKALQLANAAAFILTGRDMTGAEIAKAFVIALPRMIRILNSYDRPILATVSGSGTVTVKIVNRVGGKKQRSI